MCLCALLYVFHYDNAGSVSLMKGILMRCGTQRQLLSAAAGVLTPRLDERERLCIVLRE